jgi:alpha-tubulin suppressor-like RCC1 family protein
MRIEDVRSAHLTVVPRLQPKMAHRQVIDIASSDLHSCAITAGGDLYVWGANGDGELMSDEPAAVIKTPQRVENAGQVVRAACGGHHVALLTSGSSPITFGSNEYGALGYVPGGADTT